MGSSYLEELQETVREEDGRRRMHLFLQATDWHPEDLHINQTQNTSKSVTLPGDAYLTSSSLQYK